MDMQLLAKHPDARTITINVKDSYTIANLKVMIADTEVATPSQQALFFEGLRLSDGCMLSSYGVVKESTLEMVVEDGKDVAKEVDTICLLW